MKCTISNQERRLLSAIILSGLCANSHYTYDPVYHVEESIELLDKLLIAIPDTSEVK